MRQLNSIKLGGFGKASIPDRAPDYIRPTLYTVIVKTAHSSDSENIGEHPRAILHLDLHSIEESADDEPAPAASIKKRKLSKASSASIDRTADSKEFEFNAYLEIPHRL
jgi:hypothetical protein